MRDLISMLTDVSEKDWDTKKDPSNPDRVSDDTLINYSKRGLSAKLARQIMYRTKEEYLIERINEFPSGTREAMAKDFYSYDPSVNESNVAEQSSRLDHRMHTKESRFCIRGSAVAAKMGTAIFRSENEIW
jgi:hypothetical protein